VSLLANLALRPKGMCPWHLRGAGPPRRAQLCQRLPGLAQLGLATSDCTPCTYAARTPNSAKLRASARPGRRRHRTALAPHNEVRQRFPDGF